MNEKNAPHERALCGRGEGEWMERIFGVAPFIKTVNGEVVSMDEGILYMDENKCE